VRADSLIIFAPYAFVLFALALIAVSVWSRRLRPMALAMLGGSVVSGAVLAAPLFRASGQEAAEPSRPQVRVVSYNMYRENARASEAVDWVIRQNADFVILLEAVPGHWGEIRRLQKLYPYSYGCAGAGFCSTVILSRQPAKDVWPLSRGDPENRQALSAVTARFVVAGQEVPVTAVHLDRPWPLGLQERFFGQLSDAVATVGRGGIVAGDFNSAPWTFAMRGLAEAGELHLASGSTGTWPAGLAGFLRLPLDQVYIGRCLERSSVRHGPATGSDHLPVVTDVIIGDCRA
jgi:endonuclease/exonuclease/phosphatase (EEP) superfamily protein YafD